jgi:hypothetical protein
MPVQLRRHEHVCFAGHFMFEHTGHMHGSQRTEGPFREPLGIVMQATASTIGLG